MGTVPVEVEWQFDAVDLRPVERWLAARGLVGEPPAVRRLRDDYLDTTDWRLHRAGYSLRLRRTGRASEATLKSLATAHGGLRRRIELTETVRGPIAVELNGTAGALGGRLRALVGARELRPLVHVRTTRRTFPLVLDGSEAAELALDETLIPVEGGPPARLRRVEVESRGEPTAALRNLVKQLRLATGLQPAMLSKFESALLAGGLEPARPDLGPIEYDAGSSTGEVGFAVLRRQFAAFLDHEGGTRLGEDPEELHDMRVATRRLRAALALFEGSLPVRAARFRQEFGWIAGALGAVRDLDVQLEQLLDLEGAAAIAEPGAFDPIRGLLEANLEQARAGLLQALDSPRYDRLVRGFTAMLLRGPLRRAAASRAPILSTAPDLITARYRKVRSAGRGLGKASPPERYHRLRIRSKRLRYALEFMGPVYGDPIRPLVESLVVLQDLLGLHQDANVAAARLRTVAIELGSSLPPESVFAMGAAAEASGARAAGLRTRVPKVWRGVGGKSWRALARAMARQRPAAPARPPAATRSPAPAGRAASTPQPSEA